MKAILILDEMPNSCEECTFCDAHCIANDTVKRIEANYYKERPRWCPLKPMPVKQDTKSAIGIDLVDGFKDGWEYGWNACLEELEK